ncbi:MAG TPA: TlpA family protein disulfide reductase [Nitrospiria bacterium]|nr:TlpA family protein disulfide reductase [Candidatus Manganitrophaceae bacterium]HIL33929.1 TlpA family protein disulfide reductase [Candidatus Manganitrophaceae bacterium]
MEEKLVLLNFWATWCKPCQEEILEIQAPYEEYKDKDFVVLGVKFGEKPEKAALLVKKWASPSRFFLIEKSRLYCAIKSSASRSASSLTRMESLRNGSLAER